jgi:lysophospholipase L1-like esterase
MPRTRHRRAGRLLPRLAAGLAIATVAGELVLRHGLGFGDPPLLMPDPAIEYLYRPARQYLRFGHRVEVNRWSMRSADFPLRKRDPAELRVLVIGDSVVHGGVPTDQADLATERLRADLGATLGRPVVVGNVSAGSWGPPNMLAYVEWYGTFDADLAIVVVSSHDWEDVPTWAPLSADFPARTPALALEEVLGRYLPRLVAPALGGAAAPPAPLASDPGDPRVLASVAAFRALLATLRADGVRVAVALHLERDESAAAPRPGHAVLAAAARESGVPVLELGPAFGAARAGGADLYRDAIHPTAAGQAVIAGVLLDWVLRALAADAPPPS